jgi:plastocyanin
MLRSTAAVASLLFTLGAQGAQVAATVSAGGKPVADAVVVAVPEAGVRPPDKPPQAVVDQVDKEFVPYVTPVRAGSLVQFPNRDHIRHHVYSFSAAKTFELPLYVGTPAKPVLLDNPGVVKLGCNIHDWMVAYVYVVATPHFAKTTADGKARLDGLHAGPYEARVWHPRLRGEAMARSITIAEDEEGRVSFSLTLRPESRPAPRREPYEGNQQSG